MGTYDELEINGICWQTKALGKMMRTRRPGDAVEVERAAAGDDPPEVAGYVYDDLPRRYLVQIRALEYALVEDGRLVGLATDADRDELVHDSFDHHGRDEADMMRDIFDIPRPERSMTPLLWGRAHPRPRNDTTD